MKIKSRWKSGRPWLQAAGTAVFLYVFSCGVSGAGTSQELARINNSCGEIDAALKNGQSAGLTLFFFAAVPSGNSEEWRSFPDEAQLQSAFPKGCYRKAQLVCRSQAPLQASLEVKSPTKEWVQNMKYYFRTDGSLEKIHYDLRKFGAYEKAKGTDQQFLVKAVRDYFYSPQGKCIKKSSLRCFNTSNGREINDAVFTDVPMPVYKQAGKLPFYSLLSKPQDTTPKN